MKKTIFNKALFIKSTLFFAVASVSLVAQADCKIETSGLYNTSFVLNEVVVTPANSSAFTDRVVDIQFNQKINATKIWGDFDSYKAVNDYTIRVSSSASQTKAAMNFGIKGSAASKVTLVTCKAVGDAGAPITPPVVKPPVVTPPVVKPPVVVPPVSGTDKCGLNNAGFLMTQSFETFSLGTPALSGERAFKAGFCVPLRSTSGFGNEAEPALSTLSGRELSDRIGREAAGQYNGASQTVRVSIDNKESHTGKSLRVLYPKSTNTSSHSGVQFDMVLPRAQVYDRKSDAVQGDDFYEDLYISYWVKFDDNFDFAFGGKLPGFYALEAYGFSPRDNEVKTRLMWRENGKLEFYLHTKKDPRERLFWDNIPNKTHAQVAKGKWHNIELRMKLNSVVGSKVESNGLLQGWLDGELRADYRDIRYRDSAAVNINSVFFSTFFGGSSGSGRADQIWWPNRDSYAWFDDVIVSPSPIKNTQ